MKQHKWHKEIKAWADGAEIEFKVGGEGEWMLLKGTPYWECESDLFRIKPQPKEPQYLYVYKRDGRFELGDAPHKALNMWHTQIIGKIKLEEDHG
jgi:hypothetical protein